ncbi:hypothetical protein L7F22_000391 [Adiantum nelumboides]|nr:hypothetical protein [Adiantum nelumboides]
MVGSSESSLHLKKLEGAHNFAIRQKQCYNVMVQKKEVKPIKTKGVKPATMDNKEWDELDELAHSTIELSVLDSLLVLQTVQAKGVQGLNEADKHMYVPPMGAGFGLNSTSIVQQLSLYDVLPNASTPFGSGLYRFSQARVVEDHTMSQVVLQGMADGGSVGILLVVVGATHILFGSKGTGVPARISKNLKKRTQAVILLNPERQRIRKEGELPEADFLWYSAAKECSRNCFDRAEIARVMDAAGRRRDALPKDLQAGLDLGLIPPELLKDFFDLDKQPFIAELTKHFQGFCERWLADPRFLQRLGIEEAISITTTLIAQYVRRKGRFFQELDYVLTDTIRGAVVDFFTVWLPAPTLSFRSTDTQSHASGILEGLTGLLGSLPDNAFQRSTATAKWDLQARVLGVVVSGMKLFSVGFIASIGTVAFTNSVLGLKQRLNPQKLQNRQNKRSPIIKTAFVYSCFLGISANLRYQAIAGLVEHWIADFYLASYPLTGNALSFVARTANSYWGTQQWVDLARFTGLQAHKIHHQLSQRNQWKRSSLKLLNSFHWCLTSQPTVTKETLRLGTFL